MDQIIIFKKNEELFANRDEAIDAFRSMKFNQGEPVIALYGPSPREAELVLAIGKRTAAGESAFNIIATSTDTELINSTLTSIQNALSDHEKALSNGSTPGHVVSGDYIEFNNGIGIVKSLSHSITFTGGSTGTFNGSKDVTISIPQGSNEVPLKNGIASSGSENLWARADHVHPAQTVVEGNAETASRLETPRKISITGAVTGNATTDFSSNVTIPTVLNKHTHEISDIIDLQDNLNLKADLDSPNFTGIPNAPTANLGTNTTQIATTAFVISEIQDKIAAAIALRFKGTLGTDGTISSLPENHTTGDVYIAIKGAPDISGKKLEPGDMVVCIKDGSSSSDEDWSVVQTNIDGAVTGPESSINNNIAIFNGSTGKIIKDSGLSLDDIAKSNITIIPGKGLQGGGVLTDSSISISHQNKPSTGEDGGGTGLFVTGVNIDELGHVSSTTKSTITGGVKAETGDYVTGVSISGTTISGTTERLPRLSISGGSSESGKYISSITVSDHDIQVYKTDLPEETGMVKVTSSGVANYLSNKVQSDIPSNEKTYPISIKTDNDVLKLSVTIDKIDAENEQSIKIRRINSAGKYPENLGEGELGINLEDRYLYSSDGIETFRLYSNATTSYDGLMSKEDKAKLEKVSSDISGNINSTLEELRSDLNKEISDRESGDNSLDLKITKEISDRTNADNEINKRIDTLSGGSVTGIKMSASGEVISPTSGIIILTEVTSDSPGLISPEYKTKIDNNSSLIDSLPETLMLDLTGITKDSNLIKLNYSTLNKEGNEYISGEPKSVTIDVATEDLAGLMSSTDKTELDRITTSNFTLGTATSNASSVTIVATKTTISTGISSNNNVILSAATQSNAGVMTAADKVKLDTTLPNQISTETSNRISADNNLQIKIDKIGLSGNSLPDLSDTYYLSGKTTIVDCLKALDKKLHEIETSMVTSSPI